MTPSENSYWFLRHSRSVIFLILTLALLGGYLAFTIPVSVFPSTNFPRVLIAVDNGVMPIDQMMVTITRPIEETVNSVPGLLEVRSITSRGSAEIDLFFRWDVDMFQTLQYVNAGHFPPMVLRRDGSIEWLEADGAPVGMFADWTYQEGSIQLEPDDLFLAYTDGVVEAVNPNGEEWGVESLLKAADKIRTRSAKDVVSMIFRSMDEFSHGAQNDDATIVVVRMQ